MPSQCTRLHLCQPSCSRAHALQWGDDQSLPIGLEVEVSILRYPEQVEDGPIDDDPGTVSDCLQALRHALSMNDVHNIVQRGVRRTPCRSAAGGRLRPTVRCNGMLCGLRALGTLMFTHTLQFLANNPTNNRFDLRRPLGSDRT